MIYLVFHASVTCQSYIQNLKFAKKKRMVENAVTIFDTGHFIDEDLQVSFPLEV